MGTSADSTRPITTSFDRSSTADDVLKGIDLRGKHMIVTGGGSGLGLAAVTALATAGAHVTIAARAEPTSGEILGTNENVEFRALDLSDLTSVERFAHEWERPVDALIANAGVMAVPSRTLTASGWELQLATNFLGHFALATGLRDHLAAVRGRVVTVSSGAQLRAGVDVTDLHFDRREYDPWVAYSQSKSADVLLAVGIARHWAPLGITANSCAPGSIHTNLQRHLSAATMQAMGAMDASGHLVHPENFKTPEQGASTMVFLATSPRVADVTGAYFEDCQESAIVQGGPAPLSGVATWSVDPVTADGLWDLAQAALPPTLRGD